MIIFFSKTLNILDFKTKKYGLIIVFLMVLSGILEVLGIGMVIPLFTVILNSGTSTNSYILNYEINMPKKFN